MFELSGIGIAAAFFAGMISFISPCVLPLVPGYISYIAGRPTEITPNQEFVDSRFAVISLSACFVLGFSTVFIILGASATVLGQKLLSYKHELNIVGGGIVTLFGLFIIGIAQLPSLQRDIRFHLSIPGGKPFSAYILGLAFGFGWTPCIGPILGAILTASATTATLNEGISLLAIYSAGLGIPFLIAAAFTDRLSRKIRMIGRFGRRLHQLSGIVMIAVGIAIMTGQLSVLSYWLLDIFPILGKIG